MHTKLGRLYTTKYYPQMLVLQMILLHHLLYKKRYTIPYPKFQTSKSF